MNDVSRHLIIFLIGISNEFFKNGSYYEVEIKLSED